MDVGVPGIVMGTISTSWPSTPAPQGSRLRSGSSSHRGRLVPCLAERFGLPLISHPSRKYVSLVRGFGVAKEVALAEADPAPGRRWNH